MYIMYIYIYYYIYTYILLYIYILCIKFHYWRKEIIIFSKIKNYLMKNRNKIIWINKISFKIFIKFCNNNFAIKIINIIIYKNLFVLFTQRTH